MAEEQKAQPVVEDESLRYLSAQDILEIDDVEYHKLEIPEWTKKGQTQPGILWIKTLSAAELKEYTEAIDGEAKRNAMVLIFMRSAVGAPKGPRMFNDPKLLVILQEKSVKVYKRIQDKILEVNGLAKGAEEARKNA